MQLRKKSFELISDVINDALSHNDRASLTIEEKIARGMAIAQVARMLADVFAKESPDFKKDWFLDDCFNSTTAQKRPFF